MDTEDSIGHLTGESIPFEQEHLVKGGFDVGEDGGTINARGGAEIIYFASPSPSDKALKVDSEDVLKTENICALEEGLCTDAAAGSAVPDILGPTFTEHPCHGNGSLSLTSGGEGLFENTDLPVLENGLSSNESAAASATNTCSGGNIESLTSGSMNYQPFVRLVRLTEGQIQESLSKGNNSKQLDNNSPHVTMTLRRSTQLASEMDRLGQSLEYQPSLRVVRLPWNDVRKYLPGSGKDGQNTHGRNSYLSDSCEQTRDHTGSQSLDCPRTGQSHIPNICDICGETFPENSQLQRHARKCCSTTDLACRICDKRFIRRDYLSKHMWTHGRLNGLACVLCNKRFRDKWALKMHMATHSNIKPFSCHICQKRFACIRYLDMHMLMHNAERLFQCERCGKWFEGKENLRQHKLTHDGEKRFKCQVCSRRFRHSASFRRHMITHTGIKKYCCTYCDKKFADLGDLKKHTPIHTGEKAHACGLCNKRFARRSHLNTHMLTHTGEKPHRCGHCGKRFAHRSSLKGHLRTHTGERPYACQLCPKTFTNRNGLTCHMVTHTGARLYPCKFCFKKFTQDSHRTTHMITHTGEKPYRCHICGLGAITKGLLRRHLLIHTGEKPHACYICGKKFAILSYMKAHRGQMHGNKT